LLIAELITSHDILQRKLKVNFSAFWESNFSEIMNTQLKWYIVPEVDMASLVNL